MTFKTKNKLLFSQDKQVTIEYGEKLKINEFTIPGPGEYEVGGVLVFSPEQDLYSIRMGGHHILFWRALNGQPKVDSEGLGAIDIMVLELGEKSSLKDVTETINNLEPADIMLSKPDLRDELIKSESLPTQKVDTWKLSQEASEKDRELILLPCSES